MDVKQLGRRFRISGMTLDDPAPGMPMRVAIDCFAQIYPHLASATATECGEENGFLLYELKADTIKTKG